MINLILVAKSNYIDDKLLSKKLHTLKGIITLLQAKKYSQFLTNKNPVDIEDLLTERMEDFLEIIKLKGTEILKIEKLLTKSRNRLKEAENALIFIESEEQFKDSTDDASTERTDTSNLAEIEIEKSNRMVQIEQENSFMEEHEKKKQLLKKYISTLKVRYGNLSGFSYYRKGLMKNSNSIDLSRIPVSSWYIGDYTQNDANKLGPQDY